MRIVSADVAVFDPPGTARWYRDALGAAADGGSTVLIGGTVLRFHDRGVPAAEGVNHLAFRVAEARLAEAVSTARAAGRHLPGDDGADVQDWPFLSARAVYLADPQGDVLELIARTGQTVPEGPLAGPVVEVGLLVADAREAAALLAAAGVPTLGEADEAFGFAGDLEARLVLTARGRPWFPTTDAPASETVLAVEIQVEGAPAPADVALGSVLVRVRP